MNLDKKISFILICIILVGIIGILYILVNPGGDEKFTEFYILGANGKASDYPTNLSWGEMGNVTVVIVNMEQSTVSYYLMINQSNHLLKNESFTLNSGEKMEVPFNFTANSQGQQKIEFNLYKLPDTKNVYRYLFLMITVK